MPANHFAAAEAELLFISQNKKESRLVCRPRGCEKESEKAAGGLTGVQTDVGNMGKVGGFGIVTVCPQTLTELRFDCFALDRVLTSPLLLLPELEGCAPHMHTHCQRSGKHSNCHGRNTLSAFTHPFFHMKTNLLCTACVIHQQVR